VRAQRGPARTSSATTSLSASQLAIGAAFVLGILLVMKSEKTLSRRCST
jgi:hypothetical protein